MARYCSTTSFPSWYVTATLASLLIILGFHGITTTCSATRIHIYKKANTDFITTRCSTTTYPRLCMDSLSAHANTIQDNPSQLAQTAISVCLADAQSTSAVLSRLADPTGGLSAKDVGAVSDCKITMGDCVAKLQKSLAAMGSPSGRKGLALIRMNDIETWLSSALTDVTACKDGLGGGSTEKSVNDRMANTEQLTSIALALANGLSSPSP